MFWIRNDRLQYGMKSLYYHADAQAPELFGQRGFPSQVATAREILLKMWPPRIEWRHSVCHSCARRDRTCRAIYIRLLQDQLLGIDWTSFASYIYLAVALCVRELSTERTRRFDLGFTLFNRTFDIEKKPLKSIGLVAGALVAVAYWSWRSLAGW